MKTIVLNLFGGPGCGKSTMCAGVYSYLKWNDINCEMALEYAKDCVWSDTHSLLKNQTYIFAQQHNRVFHLLGKVDVIVTDSPLLLSIIYDSKKDVNLTNLTLNEFGKLNDVNYLLQRRKKYNPSGRSQTEDESKSIDSQIKKLLNDNNIAFTEAIGAVESVAVIGNDIIKRLR